MSSIAQKPDRRNSLERFLSIFADVRREEGFTAVLLMVNVFMLLTSYYLIKPVREALILGESGAVIKSYAGAAQAGIFLLIVPLYGALASRVNRMWLINGVTAFFISNLLIFYMLGNLHVSLGVAFFLWVGLFNVVLLAQFWGFANDIYTQRQGRRLFAILGIGSCLGGIFGSRLAGRLFQPLGPYPMMLAAAAFLCVSMVLTNWTHRHERAGARSRVLSDQPQGSSGGFELVFKHQYLLSIAALVLLSNLVNSTGEFILGKTVAEHAKAAVALAGNAGFNEKQYIGEFYADFFFWVNLLGAALEMFVVSRFLKYFGIGAALFVLPVIAFGSYALLVSVPVLSFIRLVKIAENSADYSIQNTARHALFLQTSREAKYKAKTAIDSFFWRAGDALSALLVFIGTRMAFDIRGFAIVNAMLAVLWLCVAAFIVRFRKELRGRPAVPEADTQAA